MWLILCGFTCSGKTTFGKAAARRLNIPFFDTDAYLEKPPRILYQSIGEKAFREKEKAAVESISQVHITKAILSLGGGTLVNPETASFLKEKGKILYLKASFSKLYSRILKKGIPAYVSASSPQESLKSLATERFSLYEHYAEIVLDTDSLSFEEIIQKLCDLYGQ